MIKVQETTKSFDESQLHTYFLTDDKFKCLGYIKHGTDEVLMFKTPLQFTARGRTFKKLK